LSFAVATVDPFIPKAQSSTFIQSLGISTQDWRRLRTFCEGALVVGENTNHGEQSLGKAERQR
jgi:hypothetical protein